MNIILTILRLLTIPQDTRIEEDSPAWDCHTMGNKVCGPTLSTMTREQALAIEPDQDKSWKCVTDGDGNIESCEEFYPELEY